MEGRLPRKSKSKFEMQMKSMKNEERKNIKQIRAILKKNNWNLTEEESSILAKNPHIVQLVEQRIEKHKNLCERVKEIIDPPNILDEKCRALADALKLASSVVVYTGAGISTAAKIPDYRGPKGIWTLLEKGKKINVPDLSVAEPTFTHMAIRQLYANGIISHVVSQNCDGLHLRSGLPRKALSEVHGNMFIEVCTSCKPLKQYFRLFDVTENTGLHRHLTGRFCKKCKNELRDTIVHFGERGKFTWPLNWKGAAKAASSADLILCLGSSLKILKRYSCLWASDKPAHKKPKLYIVNLQWTPKDSHCTLKINGKCDTILKRIMTLLDISVPSYEKKKDPLFRIGIPLTPDEKESTSRKEISLDCDTKFESIALHNEHCYAQTNIEVDALNEDSIKCEDPVKMEIDNESKEISLLVKSERDESETSNRPLNEKQDLSGWYGKGAKLKKVKRRKTS